MQIERNPRRFFRNVREQPRNKGQTKHRGFCFDFSRGEPYFQSQSNMTRHFISLFGHNLGLLTITKWPLRT